jgi:hypothetical protein
VSLPLAGLFCGPAIGEGCAGVEWSQVGVQSSSS